MAAIDDILARLSSAHASFVALRPAIEAREPWPLADAFGVEPEASWGAPEVLGHVAEMLRFWLGEIERVVAGSPEPVPFGRVASDDLRIGVIGRDRSLPVGELYSRISAEVRRYQERLPTLTPDELEKRGAHPTAGDLTVTQMVERFAVGHFDEHVTQLETILGT